MFKDFKKVYLVGNGFVKKNKIDYSKLFKENEMKDELKNKLIKNGLYQKDALERIIEDKNFTIEDKLFANRLAFLVFKH